MTAVHCDIETGIIYGAKEGTKDWYHEEGHLVYTKSNKGSTFQLYQKTLLHGWFATTSLAFFVGSFAYASVAFILAYLGLEVYEELWCEKYARQKIKEKEATDGKTSTGEN